MIWMWIGFIAFILAMLALDLGVLNRKARVIRTKDALIWSAFCAGLAMAFSVLVYFMYEQHWFGIGTEEFQRAGSALLTLQRAGAALHEHGDPLLPHNGHEAAVMFFTGWVIEQSLSLDNIFIIAVILAYFGVPGQYQHRVLFWGIMGALVMRGIMIALGAALIHRFNWVIYVFGGLLLLTAVKMLLTRESSVEPERNPLVRLARRIFPVTTYFEGEKFFTHIDGRRAITPLFLVLLVIESTDVLFAVDSIPAVFAITKDPFLVFTSNVFAILNLRSLYFALAGIMDKFRYLKMSLVFVLGFVGIKMILSHHFDIPTLFSLGMIGGMLLIGVVASMAADRRSKGAAPAESGSEP